nr:hypothetical protein [Tanacetum cinerariifolium]
MRKKGCATWDGGKSTWGGQVRVFGTVPVIKDDGWNGVHEDGLAWFKNNREVHLKYLKHLKESVATIREIVEEARGERPLDSSLSFACLYTKRSQELVEYAVGTKICSFGSLKKSVFNISYSTTNKAFQVPEDPSGLESLGACSTEASLAGSLMSAIVYALAKTSCASDSLCASFLTPGYISSGLVQNLVSLTTNVPPSKRDYEILFQPLFDECFNPPPCAVSPDSVVVAAPRPVDPVGSPLSTTIDQDVPSASTSPTNQEIQSQVTHQGVKEQIHGH